MGRHKLLTMNTADLWQFECREIRLRDAEAHCRAIISRHEMFQHANARPHVSRICTQFLEAENVPVLPWPAYSAAMKLTELVWDALDQRVRQRVPVPANIQQLRTAIEEEWETFHRPQSTA